MHKRRTAGVRHLHELFWVFGCRRRSARACQCAQLQPRVPKGIPTTGCLFLEGPPQGEFARASGTGAKRLL
eukprot:2566829-Lingulodinium_polyedra.AAC.1